MSKDNPLKLDSEVEKRFDSIEIGEVYDHVEKQNGLISGRARHLIKQFLATEIKVAEQRGAEKKLQELVDLAGPSSEHLRIILKMATAIQNGLCSYGTKEGDGRTCDCKFGGPEPGTSERTGCAEARTIIWEVLALAALNPPIKETDGN